MKQKLGIRLVDAVTGRTLKPSREKPSPELIRMMQAQRFANVPLIPGMFGQKKQS